MSNTKIFILGLTLAVSSSVAFAQSTPDVISGTISNGGVDQGLTVGIACSPASVTNGTVNATTCVITCNSGYTKSGNTCIQPSGGGGGGGGGKDYCPDGDNSGNYYDLKCNAPAAGTGTSGGGGGSIGGSSGTGVVYTGSGIQSPYLFVIGSGSFTGKVLIPTTYAGNELNTIKLVLQKINSVIYKKRIGGVSLNYIGDEISSFLGFLKSYKLNKDPANKAQTIAHGNNFLKMIQSYKNLVLSDTYSNEAFEYALAYVYKNGLTKYYSVDEYRPLDKISRQEASKFFVQFYTNVLSKTGSIDSSLNCEFDDSESFDSTLTDFIVKSCELGLMRGSNGNFMPKNNITKAEFITVLMRMMLGKPLDETTSPWYKNYYDEANKNGIVDWDISTMVDQIIRADSAIYIYRANN